MKNKNWKYVRQYFETELKIREVAGKKLKHKINETFLNSFLAHSTNFL